VLEDSGSTAPAPLLEVAGLQKTYSSAGLFGPRRRTTAARAVSFQLCRGEAVALVGESGSGKSTIARLLLRLEPPDGGRILLDGEDVLSREPRHASLAYRGRVQMVFQDPFGSLNTVHTVAHHLVRPLLRHHRATPAEARARALELLHQVGLEPAEELIDRHPYELSGGQRQRVAIARALAVEPDVLIADEPTSMLDVSIRLGVLELLARLKRERNVAILLITHDLASARYLADRVLVLYRGRIVEDGPCDAVVSDPAHPYSRELLDAIADAHKLVASNTPKQAGAARTPAQTPAAMTTTESHGCPFAPRCPDVLDVCWQDDPLPRGHGEHLVRCHLYPTSDRSGGMDA